MHTCVTPEWAFVLLGGIMYENVSLEFVFPVECCGTCFTLEWFLTRMYQHVHLQVMLSLESLRAHFTWELA